MQKLIPQISAVGWTSWLLTGIVASILFPPWSSSPSITAALQLVVDFGVKATGIALSILLARHPHRAFAFLLFGVSLFAFWRFFIGEIVFRMHPALGGLTFSASMGEWWQRLTSSPLHAALVLPFAIFVILSLLVWPWYGLFFRNSEKTNMPRER